jgi:hypothetical protein
MLGVGCLPLRIVLRDFPSCADPELTLCLPLFVLPFAHPCQSYWLGWVFWDGVRILKIPFRKKTGQLTRWIDDPDVLLYEYEGQIKAQRNGVFTCLWHKWHTRARTAHAFRILLFRFGNIH